MYSVYFSNNLAGKSAVTCSIYRNDAPFFPAIAFFMKIMGAAMCQYSLDTGGHLIPPKNRMMPIEKKW